MFKSSDVLTLKSSVISKFLAVSCAYLDAVNASYLE